MYIAKTDSTNNLLRAEYLDREDLFTIVTDYQTAGRGQQGNGWESEEGKNLLFSTLLTDWDIPQSEQFVLNQIVSLSLYKAVVKLLDDTLKTHLSIKWPNDLYYGNKKLAGILIENIWQGTDDCKSIVGIGLNVNQNIFRSSAPNPVSLCQIVGKTLSRETILKDFLFFLQQYRILLHSKPLTDVRSQVQDEYMHSLYRREGVYRWQEREVSLQPTMPQMKVENGQFSASIHSITSVGELVLLTTDNTLRTFHFKQIRYVIG